LKSVRVALGDAADADELPWSIPGIDPLIPGELDVVGEVEGLEVLSLQPATVRAAAAATAAITVLTTVVEINMVAFLCELSKEVR
jgi:hypothetical protein